MNSFRDTFEMMGSKDGMGRALKTIADQYLRINDQGSRIKDQGSWIKDQGSRIKDHRSRINFCTMKNQAIIVAAVQ